MNYNVRYPSPALRPYIKLYWEMDGILEGDTEHIQRIVPTGLADMTFYFDDVPQDIIRKETAMSRSVINGQQTSFFDLKVRGHISLFSVTFTPQGTRQFFNIPISEIYNMCLPLKMLAGKTADEIEEQLFHAPNMSSRIEVVEKFLFKKLLQSRKYEFRRMDYTIRTISASRGICRLTDLSGNACLSRKQFERSFSEHIGITPKQFLRVIRFQNSLSLKSKSPGSSITRIAHESGYSDQSHMVREFKRISGLTPRKYFASCDPVSDYFI